MFCLLNMITGILECGWISFGLAHAMPLWQILCYPLAYYLGKLFPKSFSLSKKVLFGFCSAALIAAVILTAVPMPDIFGFVLTCLCLFLLSAVIQTVKDSIKSGEHSLLKRFFRVAGFALSPLAAFRPQIILFVAVVIAFCGLIKYTGKEYHFTVPAFEGNVINLRFLILRKIRRFMFPATNIRTIRTNRDNRFLYFRINKPKYLPTFSF